MPPLPSRLHPGEVRVYYADAAELIAASGGVDRALAWLQSAEPERFARYRGDADRMMFLCGRIMARGLVGRALGIPPDSWRWQEGPHGRPEIAAPETTLKFNLAHSAGLVACAVADGRDVGVDVEHVTRPPIDLKMVRRYCSPAEADDIEAHGEDGWQRRFLIYWTLKEAYLKARGLGISVPLSEITFDLNRDHALVRFDGSLEGTDTRWCLRFLQPTPDHLLAIAASTADGVTPSVVIDKDLGGLF